ncbi:MAG: DUF1156 domain-containing protein, partial [Clostridia bacterium]
MESYKRKLIEVALPLDAINEASRREKSIRHGHPSTLHLWWSRKPLATARAVLFAQLVDDPSAHPDRFPTEAAQMAERDRLFGIVRELVVWENSGNSSVLHAARDAIRDSVGDTLPPVLDPFCGGGSIPLEAQRLGLEARAGDLNPVAVLITKALIEIPPRFRGRGPVHPRQRGMKLTASWKGAAGLAEDIRYYGAWMREQAWNRIGHLYPRVDLPAEYGSGPASVIAWLWARTVASPNPALGGAHVPLVNSFAVSTRQRHEAWVEPVVDHSRGTYQFVVHAGKSSQPDTGTKMGRGARFRCLVSGVPIPESYVKAEARAGRLGCRLLAVVAQAPKGRVYLSPTGAAERAARIDPPIVSGLDQHLADDPRSIWCVGYGLTTFADLFTARQLTALTTFSDLIADARAKVLQDAQAAGLADDGLRLVDGGSGATAYADGVATYLALAVDRLADYNSTICSWTIQRETVRNTFTRQALPMTWDFAEANPFSEATGNWEGAVEWVAKVVEATPADGRAVAV